jgi:dTDP-4-amino-4,6-dideoxygalactose transaminase
MTREDFLGFGAPLIEQPEIDEVVACLRSGWIGTGPRVARFEEAFRAYKDVEHAVALNSCTAALHLAIAALGVGPGDEVIVPTMTFVATSNAVIHAGATPVLVDCEPHTLNVDPAALEAAITPRTRAAIVVHFGGRPCDMDRITAVTRSRGIALIEDCAHAIETEWRGRKAGTLGDVGCFSFYVTKNVVTGEGGMAITGSRALADRMRTLALHGMTKDAWRRFSDKGYVHYDVVDAGFKYNMMDLQAAIGIHQLARVERTLERRAEIWHAYDEAFRDLPVFVPAAPAPDTRHAHHLYTLLIDVDHVAVTRDDFLERMTQQKIGVGVHYRAVHLHPFYQERYGYRTGQLPAAEWVSERTVSLPLSPKLDPGDVADVIEAVRRSLGA